MRKKIYLSSLLLFSCTQILLAMSNTDYAVVDQEIDGLNNRDLVRLYNQIMEEDPQAQTDKQFMDIINSLLQDSALSVQGRVGLINSRTNFMRDTVRAEVHRRIDERISSSNNNNNNILAHDLDNQEDIEDAQEDAQDVSTVALNSASNTNTHVQLPLPISTGQSSARQATVPAMGSVVELPSTIEIYPPARRSCMADQALQMPRLSFSYAQRHPYMLASAALMATGVLGYALKKPLLNLLDQAKIRAQHTYRNLIKSKAMRYVASRVLKSQEKKQNNQDVGAGMGGNDSRRKNFIETLLVQLMASMNDEQLKQPAVTAVIDQAWQGNIMALDNAQFKALLRQDQRELLAKASII